MWLATVQSGKETVNVILTVTASDESIVWHAPLLQIKTLLAKHIIPPVNCAEKPITKVENSISDQIMAYQALRNHSTWYSKPSVLLLSLPVCYFAVFRRPFHRVPLIACLGVLSLLVMLACSLCWREWHQSTPPYPPEREKER